MKEKIKEHIKNILELVEDKSFPARRNITDYVELIIAEMKPEWKQEINEFIEDFYKKTDSYSLNQTK